MSIPASRLVQDELSVYATGIAGLALFGLHHVGGSGEAFAEPFVIVSLLVAPGKMARVTASTMGLGKVGCLVDHLEKEVDCRCRYLIRTVEGYTHEGIVDEFVLVGCGSDLRYDLTDGLHNHFQKVEVCPFKHRRLLFLNELAVCLAMSFRQNKRSLNFEAPFVFTTDRGEPGGTRWVVIAGSAAKVG